MTWAELRQKWLPNYKPSIPDGADVEKLIGHQFTGDRCILPGVYRDATDFLPSDVNVFDGGFIDQIKTSKATGQSQKGQGKSAACLVRYPAEHQKGSKFLVNVDALNIRKGPGTEHEVKGILTKNEQVTVEERQGKWARLTSGGWVYAAYLTPVRK